MGNFDLQLTLATGIIVSLGLLIHQSVSPETINQQIIFIVIGIGLAFFTSKIDFKLLAPFKLHLYLVSIALLTTTLVLGAVIRGSSRWLELGFFRIQPSEFIKPILVLSLAGALADTNISKLTNVLKLALVYSLPIILIFLQPDLGTALVIAIIFAAMAFSSGIRVKHQLVFGLIGLVFSPLMWFLLQDYQKQRILTFLNPLVDPLGKGYNSIQSIIAVGSGQLTGRGLGRGTQSQLKFLPEYQTDFIFASLAEELGLIGSLMLLLAFFWLILRLFSLAAKADSAFSYLSLIGIIAMFASQSIINIGMNIGLLPVTGITLPLVSSGGSSIITSLVTLGIASKLVSGIRSRPTIEIT